MAAEVFIIAPHVGKPWAVATERQVYGSANKDDTYQPKVLDEAARAQLDAVAQLQQDVFNLMR